MTAGSLIGVFFLAYLGIDFHEKYSSVSAMKIVFLTISFTGFVLFSMYEAYLSASLIVKIVKPPVNRIEDIVNFRQKLVMSNGGSIHKMFLNANHDSIYGKILESGKIKTTTRESAWIKEALKSNNHKQMN